MDEERIDAFLSRIYYSPRSPASFYGPHKLWDYIKGLKDRPPEIDLGEVIKWLQHQTTHTIHSTPQTTFPTEHIIVEYPDMQWDADLLQMTDLVKYNDGYKYILVCIDLFSRYLWVRPLKSKTAVEVANMFKEILNTGRHCESVRTDQGKEFMGSAFQEVLRDYTINHIIAYGQHKANYAERVNRTIEDRLYKYFYEKQTFRYVDILDDVTYSYNHTKHGSIGRPPADVNAENTAEIYKEIYIPILNKRAQQKVIYSFNIGDLVRLSHVKTPFARGYQEQYTEELFKILHRNPSHPPRYKVRDLADEVIKGSFYEQELQKVNIVNPNDIVYKIDHVVGAKTVRGQKLSLIKWYGYSDKFNSYIPTSEIKQYIGK